MDTGALKTFAIRTRKDLISQVARRLDAVLPADSDARREAPAAMAELDREIARTGRAAVIDRVAYTWFNRFTALRYMDARGYLAPRVVSPADGETRPEILSQAVQGILPDHLRKEVAAQVRDLLEGRAPSREPQVEAYRRLVVASCNALHGLMPFLFERIADYTELLMPNELLAETGWVAELRAVMTPDACEDVEIIGWLYQFYISEKKQDVFDALKKNVKITAANIPAATQLFTPHWIVRYLVENSLGRLWLLNHPESQLAAKMDYYIAPEEPETDFLRVDSPEEIRICDPACGSGHMLTYAFDLLYEIYEEEGFPPAEIPGLILTHNLTGIEIDDRAGALAAFALAMKAAAKLGRRRFLRMEVKPDVVVLENVEFTGQDRLGEFLRMIGQGSNIALADTLAQFGQAKNFGSLIVPKLKNPGDVLEALRARDFGGDILLEGVRDRVVAVLRMAEALAPRYHVVVANPPYMGGKGMNSEVQEFTKKNYPDSKSDLFAAFIERGLGLAVARGFTAMVTMESWMFLGSFEKLRIRLLEETTIQSMVHMPYLGKGGTSMGINFGTCAFVCERSPKAEFNGRFCCVRYFETDDSGVPFEFPPKNERLSMVSSKDFEKIPGRPIAYWVSEALRETFPRSTLLGEFCDFRIGMATGKNEWHVRQWQEVSRSRTGFGAGSREIAKASGRKWFPYAKGGEFRKWAGNEESLVNWENDGALLQNTKHPTSDRIWAHNFNLLNIFQPAICWTVVTTGRNGFRLHSDGFIFDAAAGLCQPKTDVRIEYLLGLLNSKITETALPLINPTINLHPGYLSSLPGLAVHQIDQVQSLQELSKSDWDAFETSWDFTTLPLLSPDHRSGTLEATYARLRAHWAGMTAEMKRLEEENNRIFIDAYGLQDELTPEVPIEEITLTCNPAYRYGVKGTEEEREARLLADTMKELISYAIGCMFGRYSLDAPGLILANQGDTLQDYLARIPEPTFMPDADNIIPVLGDDRFEDDAYVRFRTFLSVTFGTDRLDENLAFVREALGESVRDYLAKRFFDDHVTRYRKRPIYWLVSSPKGAFQALIYMHRYNPDTLNTVLTRYVRPLRDRLDAAVRSAEADMIAASASAALRNKAQKEIDRLNKQITELTDWERDHLYPMALQRIPIDLDDGVKRNYPRFDGVMRAVKGMASDE